MAANECIPYFEAAYTSKKTVYFGYAAAGKTFCGLITTYQNQGPGLDTDPLAANAGGNLQCPAAPTAGGAVGGVIGWDIPSTGRGPVVTGAGTLLPVTSGAAVTAGDLLKVTVAGKVITATTGAVVVGKAHSTVGATDLDVIVELYETNPTNLSA